MFRFFLCAKVIIFFETTKYAPMLRVRFCTLISHKYSGVGEGQNGVSRFQFIV